MRRSRRKKFKPGLKANFNTQVVLISVFSVFALSLLFGLGWIVFKSDIFIVKKIVFESSLEGSLQRKIIGTSIFNIKTRDIYADLVQARPEYKEVFVVREFPSTLRIEAVKRQPFAQWKGRGYFLVDREGVVITDKLDEPENGFIPVEISDSNSYLKKGSQVKEERLYTAFSLIEKLKANNLEVKLINVTNPDAYYFLVNHTKVIIGEQDWDDKLALFQGLLHNTFKDGLEKVEYVDLRYAQPYVGYQR